jgi:hypothetical protein
MDRPAGAAVSVLTAGRSSGQWGQGRTPANEPVRRARRVHVLGRLAAQPHPSVITGRIEKGCQYGVRAQCSEGIIVWIVPLKVIAPETMNVGAAAGAARGVEFGNPVENGKCFWSSVVPVPGSTSGTVIVTV